MHASKPTGLRGVTVQYELVRYGDGAATQRDEAMRETPATATGRCVSVSLPNGAGGLM